MQSRAVRLILLFLFFIAIGTASFLFWKGDSEATRAALAARTFDASARTLEREILDLRAAQLGYAAPGQNGDRWVARVADSLERVRTGVQQLKTVTTLPEARTSLDAALTAMNDFAKSDKRAAEYVRTEQRLLAADVVFGDGIERTDMALAAVEKAHAAELQALDAGVAVFKSRQAFAIATGAAAAVLVVLLLLPVGKPSNEPVLSAGRGATHAKPEAVAPSPTAADLAEKNAPEIDGIASLGRRPAPPDAVPALDAGPVDMPLNIVVTAGETARPPVVMPVPAHTTDFAGVASLCVDLARVVDTRALPSLLDRTASILDASGIILWIADPDGRELNPIFAQGYPQQLVNRLGTIPRDAENATAAAFRTSLLQTVAADDISSGAIAAPLVTAGGCVGVMAAEVRHDSERQEATLAAATIVAAQLATLVGPPSARQSARTASGA